MGGEAVETKSASKPWEVDDGLWARIEPLLPVVQRRYRHPGRRRLDDRQVLCGILFVLYTGIPWRFLPQELGFGSGMTCWRRLRDWNEAGVWQRLHELLLAELRRADMLDPRAAVDSSHIRAMKGGPATGPSPVDRGKTGSKHHVIVEAHGIPLATITTSGNRNDVTRLIPLIEAVPPIRGKRGQPLRRPRHLYADRGYNHDLYRDRVRRFEITPHIARRGTEHGSGLGVYRWVVEGTIALLHWFRRLRIRWEIRNDIHHAFVTLSCAVICWRRLKLSL
ncbi:IS5 family transposase [Streptomyces sp. NPDC058676]|uniref:IS5 family transposase n=1 Tax=unclassified Streptomyces TaxID=2593676 RepID=UPI00365D5F23